MFFNRQCNGFCVGFLVCFSPFATCPKTETTLRFPTTGRSSIHENVGEISCRKRLTFSISKSHKITFMEIHKRQNKFKGQINNWSFLYFSGQKTIPAIERSEIFLLLSFSERELVLIILLSCT